MQSGIDTSRLRIQSENEAASTSKPTQNASNGDFFGADGLSFRDVLDAINPLNHIPIVSDIFASVTQHPVSTASQLAGGAIFGGPIGVVASLAGMVFKSATGSTPGEAMVAAVTGESTTQVAQAITGKSNDVQLAKAAPTVEETQEFASLEPAAAAPVMSVSVSDNVVAAATSSADKAVLALYGDSGTQSAHRSYRQAQFRPYLQDVTHSKIL